MDLLRQGSLALAALIVGAGCKKSDPPSPPAPALGPPPRPLHLDHAQPKLPTVKLWLGSAELEVELAIAPVQIATGMMFRKQMAENEGMLFVFGQPHRTSFYMKNTFVPLSAAYVGSDGAILEIHDLQPLDEQPVEAGTDQVQFVLEVKQGWFARHKVGVGSTLRTELGSLQETFFGRPKEGAGL